MATTDTSIKAIIFDFGGVLLRTEDRSYRDQVEKKYHLSPGESEQYVFSGELGTKAQLGELTIHQLWRRIGLALDLNSEQLDNFRELFWKGDQLDDSIVGLIEKLSSKYKLAIISNAFDDLHHVLHNELGISHLFQYITVSAVEGIMKPDPEIFHLTLKRLQVEPCQSVFVDDFIENIRAAEMLGMRTVHFVPELDLEIELAKLGVKP